MDKKAGTTFWSVFPLGIVSQGETNGAFKLVVSHFRSPNTETGRSQSLSLPYPPCQPTLTDRRRCLMQRTVRRLWSLLVVVRQSNSRKLCSSNSLILGTSLSIVSIALFYKSQFDH
jgi:hypothetical protein